MERLNDIRQAAKQAFTAGKLLYSIELYEQLTELTKDNPLIDDEKSKINIENIIFIYLPYRILLCKSCALCHPFSNLGPPK